MVVPAKAAAFSAVAAHGGEAAVVELHEAVEGDGHGLGEWAVAIGGGAVFEGLGDDAEVVEAEVEEEGDAHEFVVVEVVVFVAVEGFKPAVVGVVGVEVVLSDALGEWFAAVLGLDEFGGGGGAVGDPVHSGAVEGVNERGGVAHEHEAVSGADAAGVWEVFPPVNVAFEGVGVLEEFARDGMVAEKVFEAGAQGPVLGPGDAALVEDDADADVSALEGDDPGPPAVAHEVVGGGGADAVAGGGEAGVFYGELVAVHVEDAAPSGPDGGGGVGVVGLEPVVLAGDEGGDAGGVHDPAGFDGVEVFAAPDGEDLFAAGVEFDVLDGGGTPELRADGLGAVDYFLVEGGSVHLVGGDAGEVASADLAGVFEGVRVVVGEPEAHALFDEVGLVEVLGEAQDVTEEVGADFDGGFAHATGEDGGFLDDEEAEVGLCAEEEEGGGGAGE